MGTFVLFHVVFGINFRQFFLSVLAISTLLRIEVDLDLRLLSSYDCALVVECLDALLCEWLLLRHFLGCGGWSIERERPLSCVFGLCWA